MQHAEYLDYNTLHAVDWTTLVYADARIFAVHVYTAALAFGNMRLARLEDQHEGWANFEGWLAGRQKARAARRRSAVDYTFPVLCDLNASDVIPSSDTAFALLDPHKL